MEIRFDEEAEPRRLQLDSVDPTYTSSGCLAQRICDEIVPALLKQNARSVSATGHCVYHGPNGLRCAVGMLIPSDIDTKEIEATGIENCDTQDFLWAHAPLFYNSPDLGEDEKDYIFNMLERFQDIHDTSSKGADTWLAQLQEVVDEYGLVMPPN